MSRRIDALLDANIWAAALEKYGALTHMSVALYDVDERIVCGPLPSTPLFALFEEYGYAPGILIECARQCLAQAADRPAVIVAPSYGLAVVGTSLSLGHRIVGAAVAGYALVDFSQSSAIERLARQAGVPFRRLWEVATQQQPVPQRRLVLQGELLQVLGDAILCENDRTRQYEEIAHRYEDTAARLKTEMAAKDEFLAMLSHELRTPLSPILGWARILKRADTKSSDRRKAVDSIERNALLQLKLVDDLLDLNRVIRDKVPLDLRPYDLMDILRSALDTTAEMRSKKKIEIRILGSNGPVDVEGDAGRLQQIFVNVISNAVKFTPSGGRIRLIIKQAPDTVIVRIEDTGEGIEATFLPHVFEMFRQQEEGTRRRHSGLGIGLALVKRLVEMHGGGVEVTSGGAGHGTQVTIQLPLLAHASPKHDRRANSGKGDRLPLNGLSILVIDDTEDSLEATRIMLEVLGACVLVARNGLEGLEVIGTSDCDLILCDLRMPEMDGFEFLLTLGRVQGEARAPVVAMSGLVSQSDHQRTQTAGFAGHLDKPFDDHALVMAVRLGLDHRRDVSRSPQS